MITRGRRPGVAVALALLTLGWVACGLECNRPSRASVTRRGEAGAARSQGGRRLVAYYPLWIQDSYAADQIGTGTVTDVVQSAIYPRADGTLDLTADGSFPTPNFVSLVHAVGAHAILSVADNEDSHAFARMAASPAARQRFVGGVLAIVQREGYDGIDLDWEFPRTAADGLNLSAVLGELRAALGPARSLSLAVPASVSLARAYDLPGSLPAVDWVTAMAYSLGGDAPGYADGNAPLYSDQQGANSADTAVQYYLSQGVPPSKLLLGLPFFGERFDTATALHQPLTAAEAPTIVSYRDVIDLIDRGWTVHRDPVGQEPYLLGPTNVGLSSYDDPTSIGAKCRYVQAFGLGGAAVWHVSLDLLADGSQPLLAAAQACR